jgi:L-alanine-DL-glutamate epimerase-like enolase superfamily enzyme
VVLLELEHEGILGLGESAPSTRYDESVEKTAAFLAHVDPQRLSFSDLEGSMHYVENLDPGNVSAKGALNLALLDGAARLAGRMVYDYLGLGFTEGRHTTCFSIGIDTPEMIRRKVREADIFPGLKLKVGNPEDRENFQALREVAPNKPVRADANEGWKTKEEALERIEWMAQDGNIEFVEQPMPASASPQDMAWLKERSPLPLYADESFHLAGDASLCADCFHGVNVKLMKTGGITRAKEALEAARNAGLKTMIGCMIETSILISAGAHLAELADYLDLDGNILCGNDPYEGVVQEKGVLSFARAKEQTGLCVRAR